MDLEYKTVKNREMYTHMCLKDSLRPIWSQCFHTFFDTFYKNDHNIIHV